MSDMKIKKHWHGNLLVGVLPSVNAENRSELANNGVLVLKRDISLVHK